MFHTLNTFDTEFSADSVEWCPASSFKDIFVCGTYQVSKDEESKTSNTSDSIKRLGRIFMFRTLNNGQLELLQKTDVPAVLDMKWAHVTLQNKILLGVVNSIGFLQIYQLKNEDKIALELMTEIKVSEEAGTLALSLDWCTGRWSHNNELNPKIIVSDSKGSISLIEISEDKLEVCQSWHAHDFEAWISAFDYWDTNTVYTGGDDCKFQRFDTRIGSRPTMVSKLHNAGVTSMHSNAAREFLFSTGSYDEYLRLWDTRNFKESVSETNLGGGIWRLKWDPFVRRHILAACMYGGFKIIDCKNEKEPGIVGEYNEHESISYGCDWCLLKPQEISDGNILETEQQNIALVSTCSFYDHTLKLSSVHLNN